MQAACHSKDRIDNNYSALLPILSSPCHLLPLICRPSISCCSCCSLCRPYTRALSSTCVLGTSCLPLGHLGHAEASPITCSSMHFPQAPHTYIYIHTHTYIHLYMLVIHMYVHIYTHICIYICISCASCEAVCDAVTEGQGLFGTSSSARMCPSCRPTSWRTAPSSAMLAGRSSTATSSMPYTPRLHLCSPYVLSAPTQQQSCCHSALPGEKRRIYSSFAGNDDSAVYQCRHSS